MRSAKAGPFTLARPAGEEQTDAAAASRTPAAAVPRSGAPVSERHDPQRRQRLVRAARIASTEAAQAGAGKEVLADAPGPELVQLARQGGESNRGAVPKGKAGQRRSGDSGAHALCSRSASDRWARINK